MVRRPESRKIEEKAVGLVEQRFNEANWQVNRFYRDFGIDLHVKIFELTEQRQATPWEFYAQVKGTAHSRIKNNTVLFSIDVDHLRLWSQVNLPVLFVLCDVTNKSAYWLEVHKYVRKRSKIDPDWETKYKTVTLKIPITNKLDLDALVLIRRCVRNESLHTHAHSVVSVIREWVNRSQCEYEEHLLPVDPTDFPALPPPSLEIDEPVLAYCWGCRHIWWMDYSQTLYDFDEDEGMWCQWPLMYIGSPPQPDAYFVDPDFCPRCLSGEGYLDLCTECGTPHTNLDKVCDEEDWGDKLVSFEEANHLCQDCLDKLRAERERKSAGPPNRPRAGLARH